MKKPVADVLVVIPTYNEAQNLERVLTRLFASCPSCHALVVDDMSPDGTGALADQLASQDQRVHVLHRQGKGGLGSAYVAGLTWGTVHGYRVLVEMDADGSHPAETLPAMLDKLTSSNALGLVIGSRWVKGGSVVDWPKRREYLSRTANWYARSILGIDVKDATAGFRAFTSAALRGMQLETVDSRGYCFQIDMTLRALDAGFAVAEVPIVFKDRELGTSKMSGDIISEAMTRVTIWGLTRRWQALKKNLSHRAVNE